MLTHKPKSRAPRSNRPRLQSFFAAGRELLARIIQASHRKVRPRVIWPVFHWPSPWNGRRGTPPLSPMRGVTARAVQLVSRRAEEGELKGKHASARTPDDTNPEAASSTIAALRSAVRSRQLPPPP